jgi:hypothetical protein
VRRSWSPRRLSPVPALAFALAAGVARAQLASDDVPQERIIPEREKIDNDLQRSRLRLGPVRLLPSIAITNAGYDSNVFATSVNPVSDWTFTVRGGLRFLLPMGTKMYFRADALPQYTWYDKVTDRRTFGGIANASLFGFFNHMTVQLTGYGAKDFGVYSTEFVSRVLSTTVGGNGAVEVQITPALSVFGRGEAQRIRYDNAGQVVDVTINDRTETAARGGVRYRISEDWSVSSAYEQTWSDFDKVPQQRNNQSRAYLLGVQFGRPRFFVNVSGGYREGRPMDDSAFPPYSTPTGTFFASFYATRWLEIQAYGKRGVVYSIESSDPYFITNQIGGGLNIQPLDRVLVKGFATTGPNQYPLVPGETTERRDERTIFGGGVSVRVTERGVVTGLVTRDETKTTSSSTLVNPAVTRFTLTVSLSGELVR